MSNKLSKHLKTIAKQNGNNEKEFHAGGVYARHVFDTDLVTIFGQTLGVRISDFLITTGVDHLKDKKPRRT